MVEVTKSCALRGGNWDYFFGVIQMPQTTEVDVTVETNSIFAIKRGLIWVDYKYNSTQEIEINDTTTHYNLTYNCWIDGEDVKVTVKFILFDNIPYLIIGIIILINALFRIRRIYWEIEEEKGKQS